MKRIRSVTEYDEDQGYPTTQQLDPERRATLLRLLGGAATAGAALLVGGAKAGAGTRGKGYLSTRFDFQPTIWKRSCRVSFRGVLVQTKDARLIAFIKDRAERKGIDGALRPLVVGASCGDFTDGKRLAALQRKLGTTLAKRFRGRKKRRTARPIVTLSQRRSRPKHPIPPPGVPPHP